MSRTIGLDPETGEIVVAFRFDRALKDRVKAIAGSRFHWGTKTWRFAPDRAPQVLSELVPRGFQVVDESLAETAPTYAHTDPAPVEAQPDGSSTAAGAPADSFTVSSLHSVVNAAIADRLPGPVWVVGTLAEYDRGTRRAGNGGHAWCRVVEEDEDGRALAVFQAVMFATARARIEQRLSEAGLGLADGLAVRVRGTVQVYVPRGTLQLVIDDIDPAWSVGELAVRRDEILRQLRAEELDRLQLELPAPAVPRRIALVTSAGSDAYHDVLSSLRQARFPVEVVPFDVRVQGPELATTVCAALEAVAAAGTYDLVVVTRGGGSRVELAGWDDLRVARAVAQLATKVLVAIGHHQDRSVLDEIALSAKTPTAAGEWIVEQWAAAEQDLRRAAAAVERTVHRSLAVERARLAAATRGIEAAARHRMRMTRSVVDGARPRLESAVRARMRLARARADRLEPRLSGAAVRRSVYRRVDAVERLQKRLERGVGVLVRQEGAKLSDMAGRLRLAHPDNVLRRGFSIVRDAAGHPLTTVAGIDVGAPIEIRMADGRVAAEVTRVETDPGDDRE